MSSKRVNITVPDDLAGDIEVIRLTGYKMNISEICQRAIRKEVEAIMASMDKFQELKDCLQKARDQIEEKGKL